MKQTTTSALRSLIVLVCSVILVVRGDEPCATTNYLSDWRRSVAFEIATDKLCDNILEAGWYRITSGQGDRMPTECVIGGFRCNTAVPIWLSDESLDVGENIFPNEGEVVNRTAYGSHYLGDCYDTAYNIQIKGCNDFLVYYLVPVAACSSAYCFGTEQPCPPGTSSDTEFTPGCGAYPDISLSPFVKPTQEEEDIQDITYSKVKFECHASDLQLNYIYDVRWYINDLEIQEARTFNLTKTDIDDGLGGMKEVMWTSKFRPNFIVNCSMKVRGNGFGSPSPEHRSEQFFAGIKITQEDNYVVNEDSALTIPVRLTIPVACNWNRRRHPLVQEQMKSECVINLLAGIPNYQTNPSQCNNEITDSGLVFENHLCGIAFNYSHWNETKHLQLFGAVDNRINIKDRIVFLRLYNPLISQANASLFMWRNIVLPDIKVTIIDSEDKTNGKGCWSLNDPHMYSFDSDINWELQQSIGGGEYIMYLHNKLPLQVNAYFRKCNGAALCNCGLAVRSGDSVFVANFCETLVEKNGIRTRKLNRYVIQRLCDDRSLVVTEDGNRIEVTIPTGTKVQFSHGKVYDFYGINGIYIYPSLLDYDITRGLCGSYNGNPADDFTEFKGFAPTSSTSDFAKSWKVGGNDGNPALSDYSLFDPAGKIRQAEYYAESYCTCRVNDTTFPYELPEYNCNLDTPMEICRRRKSTKSVFTATCATTVLRTKRSIGNHITKRSVEEDLEEDEQPQAYVMVPDSEQYNVTVEWRNGWTEESAREFCTRNMQNSPAFLPCSEFVPSSNPDTIIENCILDIKLQGDSGWIGATLQNFADSCLSQAVRMENLTETNSTTSNGHEKSIFSIIAESTCPGNCSEHGICVNGICNCTTGHYGVACAQDKSDPPSIEPDAFEGSCDPTKKPCKKFIIPGTQFIDETLTCRFSQFSIIKNDTTTILVTGDSFTYPGTYVSDFFMYCELPPSRRKRSVDRNDDLNGYNISVSNNGVDFTEELTMIIYNQQCFDCNLTSSISCVELETCPTKTEEPSEESKLSIWIIVLIVLSSLILLISIGLFCFRKKVRCGKRDPYVSDSTASLSNTFMHAQSKPPTAHDDIFLATHRPATK